MVDSEGRDIFVVDAHRDDGKRLVVRSDEKLKAFLEAKKVTRVANARLKRASDFVIDPLACEGL